MDIGSKTLRRLARTAALAALLCAPAAWADLEARLSQNPVYPGDTVTLTLSSDAGTDAAQPDLSPLERDFEVLGTATGTRLSVVNGQASALRQWQVQLLPRHSGSLTIPALKLGSARSEPLTLTVNDGPPSGGTTANTGQLFVETALEPAGATPYVQQQAVYVVRLFHDDSLREGTLSEPKIPDAVVERLGEDRRTQATRNGRRYQVLERRYAVFPQKSGVIEIPAARFEGRVADTDAPRGGLPRSGSLIQRFLQDSPFANDPFFRGGLLQNDAFGAFFGDPGRVVRAFGEPLKLSVRPAPATAGPWLPARAVRLHDSWTEAPPSLRVGEPVSRTITVEADGLSGPQIPSIDLPAPVSVRVYSDPAETATHADGSRLVGLSRQTLTYIPASAGDIEVPAVGLAWWNTATDGAARAQLPAWHLTVAPGAAGQAGQPAPEPPAAQSPPAELPPAAAPQDAGVQTEAPVWRDALAGHRGWLAAGGALAAVLLAAALLRMRRRSRAAAPAGEPADRGPAAADAGALRRTLETACAEKDAAQAARALLALAALRWPERPPRSLDDLAARLDRGGGAVRALDRHLYGLAAGPWPADALWAAVRDGLEGRPAPTADGRTGPLPPLYPHRA